MIRLLAFLFCLAVASCTPYVSIYGKEAQNVADKAVANILFDYDGSTEFASYIVNESGFVTIVFANDTPDKLYSEIVTKMQNSKKISGVDSSKTGASCDLF